jgi:hypothetical protein
MANEIITVVDQVEAGDYNGKPFKRIVTKSGETYKIGQRMEAKWVLLKQGAAVRLQMDEYKGQIYVKDFDLCYDLSMEKMAELNQPAPKNPRDASIERQVAVKCVTDLMAANVEVPEDIKTMAIEWIRGALK